MTASGSPWCSFASRGWRPREPPLPGLGVTHIPFGRSTPGSPSPSGLGPSGTLSPRWTTAPLRGTRVSTMTLGYRPVDAVIEAPCSASGDQDEAGGLSELCHPC